MGFNTGSDFFLFGLARFEKCVTQDSSNNNSDSLQHGLGTKKWIIADKPNLDAFVRWNLFFKIQQYQTKNI